MIPEFNEHGDLPVGGHSCRLDELEERFNDNAHRKTLCEKLKQILELAKRCGFIKALIGGSFPTAKEKPRDIDITWITPEDVTKETVSPDCVKLMEDRVSVSEYGWNMQYLPIGEDEERIQYWAAQFGFDSYAFRDRGVLLLDL